MKPNKVTFVMMNNKLLLAVSIISFLVLICCKKNGEEKVVLPKQLTVENHDFETFWSPDGKYIAFYTQRNTYNPTVAGMRFELYVMNRNGLDQQPLFLIDEMSEFSSFSMISWAADSKSVMVHVHNNSKLDKNSEVWQVSLDGTKTKLYSPDFRFEQLSYSPDGTKAAFLIQGPNPDVGSPVYRLYYSGIDFSDTVLIDRGLISNYKWKSDSKGFFYSKYDFETVNYNLWESSVNGTDKIQFSDSPVDEEILDCSQDGKYILYSDYKDVFFTPSDKFDSKLIVTDAGWPLWIPKSNLILLWSLQTKQEKSYTESWVVDLHGNIVKKIAEGESSMVSFSPSGYYYTYSVGGGIWLDSLP
jgi:hypothetical protein